MSESADTPPEAVRPLNWRGLAAFVAAWTGSALVIAAILWLALAGAARMPVVMFAAVALPLGGLMLAVAARWLARWLIIAAALSAFAFLFSVPPMLARALIEAAAVDLTNVEHCYHQAAPGFGRKPDILTRDVQDLSFVDMLARGRAGHGPPHVTLITLSGLWLWSFRAQRFVFWQPLRITEGVLQLGGRQTIGRPSLDQVVECLRWIGGNRLAATRTVQPVL